MPGPYDAALKELIESFPADWLDFLTHRRAAVRMIDADLATVAAAADKVVQVDEDEPWLLHIELQSGPRGDSDEQCQWYNTLLEHRHGLRVRSFLVLLKRSADSPRWTGVFRKQFPDEPPYLEFRYGLVRLWQVPAVQLLAGGLGLVPLAPLGDVADVNVPEVVRQVQDRLLHDAPPERVPPLLTAAYVLTGLRIKSADMAPLFERVVIHMKESSAYQLILAEGEAKGEARGRASEARAILLRQGRKCFGEPDAVSLGALQAITDIGVLEQLSEKLLDVSSWQELLN